MKWVHHIGIEYIPTGNYTGHYIAHINGEIISADTYEELMKELEELEQEN